MLATYNLPGFGIVQHTQTVCPQLSPAHKRKSTELQCHSMANVLHSIYHAS